VSIHTNGLKLFVFPLKYWPAREPCTYGFFLLILAPLIFFQNRTSFFLDTTHWREGRGPRPAGSSAPAAGRTDHMTRCCHGPARRDKSAGVTYLASVSTSPGARHHHLPAPGPAAGRYACALSSSGEASRAAASWIETECSARGRLLCSAPLAAGLQTSHLVLTE
jgi:hypothetical protein